MYGMIITTWLGDFVRAMVVNIYHTLGIWDMKNFVDHQIRKWPGIYSCEHVGEAADFCEKEDESLHSECWGADLSHAEDNVEKDKK